MQSKRVKTLIMQWVVPTVLLVVFLVGLLQQFREQNKKVVDSFVESSIEQTGGTYSRNIAAMLNSMKGVTDIVDEMLENRADGNIYHLVESLEAIQSSCAAFSVAYCYMDGKTVTVGYENVDVKSTDYYDRLQGTEAFFSYTKNDGFTGKPAILYVNPVEYQEEIHGYLIAYMNPEELKSIFEDEKGYGGEVFYAVVNHEGSILASFGGVKATSLLADDFWNAVKKRN